MKYWKHFIHNFMSSAVAMFAEINSAHYQRNEIITKCRFLISRQGFSLKYSSFNIICTLLLDRTASLAPCKWGRRESWCFLENLTPPGVISQDDIWPKWLPNHFNDHWPAIWFILSLEIEVSFLAFVPCNMFNIIHLLPLWSGLTPTQWGWINNSSAESLFL